MKIAVFEPYIEGLGGAQKVIAKYCSYLQSMNHSVEIFTQKHNPKTAYPDFKQIKINLIKPSNKNLSALTFSKKFKGFDIYITNDFPSNFISLKNKPTVWVCYSPKRYFYDLKNYFLNNLPFLKRLVLRLKILLFRKRDFISAKKTSLIMPISKTVDARIEKYYRRSDTKIFYCGIDFDNYKTGNQENYFLYISRLEKPKRIDLAIKAMNYVKNKSLKLYIVGQGPEESNLKNIAGKNVEFLGAISDVKLIELYSNCIGVIYTPINEDWGLIPLEAGASGKPTIGANEGGLRETIINNKTGFLINDVDEKKIAEKIDYLSTNLSKAKSMGLQAREKAKQFDWKNLLPEFEKKLIEIEVKHRKDYKTS
ncbi:glycosyltransferase family 4 protein [Nanoarchaeota archaeon]